MSLEGETTKRDWLEEIALFLQGQDTWAEPAHLAIAHADLLLCPCGLQPLLSAWRLDSRAQRGKKTAVADRECMIEGQVPDYPALRPFNCLSESVCSFGRVVR